MKKIIFAITLVILLTNCEQQKPDEITPRQQAISEITTAEKSFQKLTTEQGIAQAFWTFADSNAVIKRENDTLIVGKEAIRDYYSGAFYTSAAVSWSPDFTDASEDGKMGYTYGRYSWQLKDSTGNITEMTGVFHTVWKRQTDGGWKYVWD